MLSKLFNPRRRYNQDVMVGDGRDIRGQGELMLDRLTSGLVVLEGGL